MARVFNFSAGPAALPLPVLDQIKADLPEWLGTGMSVMELSHRSSRCCPPISPALIKPWITS